MKSTLWIVSVSALVALLPGVARAQEERREGRPGHERLRRAFEEAIQDLERRAKDRMDEVRREFEEERTRIEEEFRSRAEESRARQEERGHPRPQEVGPDPREILEHIVRAIDGLFGQVRELREGMERAHRELAPKLRQRHEQVEHAVRELHERVQHLTRENQELRQALERAMGRGHGEPPSPPPGMQERGRRGPEGRRRGPSEEGRHLLEQARDRMQELGRRLEDFRNPEMRRRVRRELQGLRGRWENLQRRGHPRDDGSPRLMVLEEVEEECLDCGRHECEGECEGDCECEQCEQDEQGEQDERRGPRAPRRIIEELREGMEGRRGGTDRDELRGRIREMIEGWRREGFNPDELRGRIERLLEGLRRQPERPGRDQDDQDRIIVQTLGGDNAQALATAHAGRTARLVVRVAGGRPQVHFARDGRGCCGDECPALGQGPPADCPLQDTPLCPFRQDDDERLY